MPRGTSPKTKPFMAVARGHIQLAHPLEAGDKPPVREGQAQLGDPVAQLGAGIRL